MVEEKTSEYSFFKLLKHIKQHSSEMTKKILLEYKVDLFDKIALPITTFALALIGIPLGVTPPRVRYNRGFLFSILVILIYYVIRAFSLNMGDTEQISPWLAAMLPVIIISIAGSWLFYRKAYKI